MEPNKRHKVLPQRFLFSDITNVPSSVGCSQVSGTNSLQKLSPIGPGKHVLRPKLWQGSGYQTQTAVNNYQVNTHITPYIQCSENVEDMDVPDNDYADEISSIDSDESTPDDDVVPASVMIASLACTVASSLMCLIMILTKMRKLEAAAQYQRKGLDEREGKN